MKKTKIDHYTDKEALDFHNSNKSGKIEIISSKPMTTKRDLALAYSPGVAAPVRAISENPDAAYDYTSKGNLVAVISNGSAVLGMGNLGALASKPVMEGKAVLFKRFADINSIDIEIDSSDPNEIVKSIKNIAGSFGGINLEDIAAPDCFVIEEKLKEILDIPVFHDDQHGTAIITCAALINALDISKKSIKKIKVVVNGAGASAIACTNLLKNNKGEMPPVIHVDSDAHLFSNVDGSLITDKMWGIYYKPDFNFKGVQGGTAPYKVNKPADEVKVDPYGPDSKEYLTGDEFAHLLTSALAHCQKRFEGKINVFQNEPSGGLGCFTPDSFPVFDRFCENVYIIADSNHGYKMMGVGKLVAEEILENKETKLLKPFRFNRYAKGELHPTSHSPFPWS